MGKKATWCNWIPGALDESWLMSAGNRDPMLQKRFGVFNAAVWGVAPDFFNLYVTKLDDRDR